MKKFLTLISSVVLLGQLIIAQTAPAQLEISLKHNDQREQQTEQQLRRILSAYDVSNWIFTRKIIIESGFNVIPQQEREIGSLVRKHKLAPINLSEG